MKAEVLLSYKFFRLSFGFLFTAYFVQKHPLINSRNISQFLSKPLKRSVFRGLKRWVSLLTHFENLMFFSLRVVVNLSVLQEILLIKVDWLEKLRTFHYGII